MDCLVLPVSIWRRRWFSGSRLGYMPLTKDGFGSDSESPVRVVVGKERREFWVDPFVLEENPFRVLIDSVRKEEEDDVIEKGRKMDENYGKKRVIFVDVDAILFEHMLWLMHNDCSSLFQLNLKEIIDFYAQDN